MMFQCIVVQSEPYRVKSILGTGTRSLASDSEIKRAILESVSGSRISKKVLMRKVFQRLGIDPRYITDEEEQSLRSRIMNAANEMAREGLINMERRSAASSLFWSREAGGG